jgi:hypothetical protein
MATRRTLQLKTREQRELAHDLEGFTRNLFALVVNQAGINASVTCAHE